MVVRGGRAEARTRKSAVTREKIMEAAAELMVERGGTDFQMMEVSARCEMSKGSLYYYFADKGELVRAVLDRSVEALVDAVERVVAQAPSAADSILGLVRALAEALRPGGPLMLAMLGSGSGATGAAAVEGPRLARVLAILTAQLERAKGEGLVREDADSRLAAAAVAGAFLVFEHVAPAGAPEGVEGLARRILDLALSGVGTERGRAVFLG
ncbi:TetR/AcrR family transcriptional regulator [Olsenella uli]|uniref:TetR/AcrR family transcriptional regulator n=1 Tax=Olsenella uli TaxID=133926 RepID=UPI00195B81A4|nr:TetR/AcrR family transcriptional regulator [Olsenella uli]MBM6817589.1 TetR/AcrR family transcriptional regulator [Olsenella uli]